MRGKCVTIYNCDKCPNFYRLKVGKNLQSNDAQQWMCTRESKQIAYVKVDIRHHMSGKIDEIIRNKPEIPKWCPLPDA